VADSQYGYAKRAGLVEGCDRNKRVSEACVMSGGSICMNPGRKNLIQMFSKIVNDPRYRQLKEVRLILSGNDFGERNASWRPIGSQI
jgi:hypothetical protein